jgi:hypothetical protein
MSVTQLAVICAEPGADGVEHLHGYISISLLPSGPLRPYLLYLLWLHPSNQGYPSLPLLLALLFALNGAARDLGVGRARLPSPSSMAAVGLTRCVIT